MVAAQPREQGHQEPPMSTNMENYDSQKLSAELVLSPTGSIYLNETALSEEQLSPSESIKIKESFANGSAVGLLHLGLRDSVAPLPQTFFFWQSFSREFITRVCKLHALDKPSTIEIAPPNLDELETWIERAPPMRGAEYLSEDVLLAIWREMNTVLTKELHEFSGSIEEYLQQYSNRWNLVGKICFHLAENKTNEKRPFAFLATYATLTSHASSTQHLPLKRALQESATSGAHNALLSLLVPVQKAAALSPFVRNLVDSGSIFEATAWTAQEAHRFLQDIPLMEASGIIIRVPNWWSPQKPPRLKVEMHLGGRPRSMLGLSSLVEFDIRLALGEGNQLSREEWLSLQQGEGNLVKIKGQWVEIDREKLNNLLSHWDHLKKASRGGLSMAEGLRLLAGMESIQPTNTADKASIAEWSQVTAGDWLKNTLEQLKNPQQSFKVALETLLRGHLQATLRPYQQRGVYWLWMLYQLRLGGCLADDMGLGKTIQVLSLLLAIKVTDSIEKKPHLLIVPASLLGNWQAEAARFAPSLRIAVAHSTAPAFEQREVDLVLTTYGFILRTEWIQQTKWNLIILDEAQAIKNPNAKQTLAVKALASEMRLVLTGTPVENRLGDLWSLFDFTSPGLLGSGKAFGAYAKQAGKDPSQPQYVRFISALRKLTHPYILRRLKSDKNVISDLPDKTEMKT